MVNVQHGGYMYLFELIKLQILLWVLEIRDIFWVSRPQGALCYFHIHVGSGHFFTSEILNFIIFVVFRKIF